MHHKMYLHILLGISFIFVTSCKPSTKIETQESMIQDTTPKVKDTVTAVHLHDTVKKELEKIDPALDTYMKHAHEEWDNVPFTLEAKYMGFEIGDYPHIIFKDKKGKEYDFGDGNNSYGSFKEDDFLTDGKSKYQGKTFKLTWEWKTSTFLCCEGEMEEHTGKVPSITSLELVK